MAYRHEKFIQCDGPNCDRMFFGPGGYDSEEDREVFQASAYEAEDAKSFLEDESLDLGWLQLRIHTDVFMFCTVAHLKAWINKKEKK